MDELYPLRVTNVCNTTDTAIISNIRSALARGLPTLEVAPVANDRLLVILASGPSGREALKNFMASGTEFDLMALNGAYSAAIEMGRVPDLYAQLDARGVNVNFLTDPRKDTKFYLASQVHPDVFEAVQGHDVTTFHLNVPSARETVPEPALFLGGNAGTIGSSAMAIACVLGYRRLLLLGYDSSLSRSGASHMRYQPQNANQALIDVWFGDTQYWTTPALADQVMGFFEWTNVLHATFPGLTIDCVGDGLFYDWVANNQSDHRQTTATEAAKYIEAYRDPYYCMSAHRRAMVRDVLFHSLSKTLLDVGTGRGETLEEGRNFLMKVKGTETVPALLNDDVVEAFLPVLPFKDGEFELVTCFEVLEHLLPKDLVPALRELRRVGSKWLVVSICTENDFVGGVNLHPSARSEEEWKKTFNEAFFGELVPEFCGNASTLGVSPIFRFRLDA